MSKSKLRNRLLSALLALCMVFALLPMGVLAASPNGESVPITERENIIPATEVHSAYQFTECQMGIIDYQQSHGSGADPNAAKTVTITYGDNTLGVDYVKITGAILEHSVGGTKRYFTTITAGDVHSSQMYGSSIHKWASIEIDTTTDATQEIIRKQGMDVYLVGFGKADGNEINSNPMKAIESLTVKGNYVSVYFVGCNIGVVKQEAYNAYDSRVCNIRVNGVDSHIYADKDTNADAPGKAVCQVQVQGSLPAGAFYNPEYDTVGYGYLQQNAIGTPEELSSTVELSNVTIRKMSSSWPTNGFSDASFENGVLDKYTGITLNKCVWGPYIYDGAVSTALNKVVLNEFAQLTLIDTTPLSSFGATEDEYDDVCAPVELNHRSTLTIQGTNRSQVIVKGRNVLRLNDAKIGGRGYILVDATCNANTYTYLSPSGMYYYENHGPEGAHLRILMSGSSTIQTDYKSEGCTPDVMVDNQGTAIFQDDPSVAGIGSLTIGNNGTDGGHAFCAAIGGTPSLYPLPHGNVTIRSGVLTVISTYGGAGIGGSVTTPTIVYKVKEGGQAHALEWNGDPANLIKIYQNTSVGYLYYDTTDDQFNPYHGGYWLRKTGNTYEPVKKNDEGNWEVVIIPADYLLDAYNNKIVDEESSTPGFSRDGGVVTVSGGVLNASAFGAAAIGGAKGGNGGEFGILSGTVNAKSTGGGAAIGGGPVNWGKPVRTGIGFQEPHNWLGSSPTTWTDGIYIDRYMYSPSMGGGSGKVFIYGGIVNATADNPAYDESGRLYSEPVYYNEDGSVFDPKEYNTTTREWEWKNYYTYTDKEYTLSFEDGVLTGRLPGYVIGSTCENANSYYENRTEILLVGGMMQSDGNPTLILQQNARVGNVGEVSASWDNFFRKQNPQGVMTQDALGRDPNPDDGYDNPLFDPSLISGACLILGIGWEDTMVIDGTTGQLISGSADYTFKPIQISENYTYRIRGQIDIPDLKYLESTDGVYNFVLPAGTELDLLPGTVLTVPEHFAIMASDMSQFIVEESSVVQGKGRWPGKPTKPETAPTTQQVRSLLEKIGNGSSSSGQGGTIVRTHLAIAETKDGLMVLSGNGVDAVQSQAEAIGLPIITIFSAGSDGFKGQTIKGVTTWKLNSRTPDTVISLIPNGALTATPGKHTNCDPDLIVSDKGDGKVEITLQSVKLHTPEYTVYQPHGTDDQITLVPESSKSPMAFKIEFSQEQVTNNDALFAVPSFSGSEFNLRSVAPLKNKCSVRYGGTLSFSTPFADFGNITIEELQLKYGDGVKLDGIAGEGSVDVPSIAGFPVSGGAKMKLNTFAPNRLVSLSVSLETPLFSGAFETSFKEVRGVILLDTLYAELAVDEGGIPLVPPTVIGYLQGGGLGISGLADTVGMDSFGAPPVRLNVAAKGSIVDVIEGWIRLSVGMDGFDLTMEDIEIADMEFIKEFGVSAKWDAGEREIHGKTYWGLSADMEQYMVIAVPATVASSYGGEDDNLPMLFSATGTIGYGGFTGYYEENGWIYFIYQLHASGSLKGSITIPKKLIGIFPFETINLANAEIGFYAAANATTKVNKTSVSGSPSKILRSLASNAKLGFDAAVGAKLTVGVGAFRFYVRAVYVFGEKKPRLSAGYGSGGDLDLSEISNASGDVNTTYAVVGELVDPENGEPIPAVIQMAAENVATMQMTDAGEPIHIKKSEGLTLAPLATGKSFTATVSQNVIGNTFLAITLADSTKTLSANELTVKRGEVFVPLTMATFDASGNQTNTANFFADAGVAYFAPEAAGTYTITSTSDIQEVNVIQTTAFASLDESSASLTGTEANYKLQDTKAESKYKVQLVLGKEEGDGDYLLAETAELTGSELYTGALSYSLAGSLAPTGSYYPSILVAEYIQAEGENGQVVETWSLIDQKSFDDTVAYTNNVIPAAPSNVTLTYSGNGTMTASWTAAQNGTVDADVYQLVVYDDQGKDTGLLFQTADSSTSMILDLSSLEAGKEYKIGVKAVFYDDPANKATSTYQLSYEGLSDLATLNAAAKPTVTYSNNVITGEGNSHTLSLNAAGGSLTVSSESALNITITNKATGTVLASGTGVKTLTYTVPAIGEKAEAFSLQIVAEDPSTKDYVLDTVSVSYDTIAPPMIPDNLGEYALRLTETGYAANVTGHAEAGASVLIYQRASTGYDEYGDYIAGATAGEDGNFTIPVRFTKKPGDDALYCVVATDAAGNFSEPMNIFFKDAEILINLNPNAEEAVCSTGAIGISAGAPVGELPVPVLGGRLFDGWYYLNGDGEEVVVNALTTFSADTTLFARWADIVSVSVYENHSVVAEYPIKADRFFGPLPVPRIRVENQMFLGWFTKEDGGDLVTENSSFAADTDPNKIRNVSLYARWSPFVTVSFNAGLGTVLTDKIQVPTSGSRIIAEYPVPTATGYTFEGWYYLDSQKKEVKVNASTIYTEDITLQAKWSRNTDKTSLHVTQTGCSADETLPDPTIQLPEIPATQQWIGETTVSYVGTGNTNYMSTVKPTEPGTYKIVVQRNTYEMAYVASAEFSITASNVARYNVTVDSNIAHGSVACVENAPEGETVTLIGVPSNGYDLTVVTVMNGETPVETVKVDNMTYTFTMPAAPVTVSATFRAQPEFKSKTLVLSGQIGVNFYTDLSMLTAAEREAATMTFAIGTQSLGSDDFDETCTNPSSHLYYGFTCFINSSQMAETITATLHYGDGMTIEHKMTVEEYIAYMADPKNNYPENAVALAKATADYGHYMTPFIQAWGSGADEADEIAEYATYTNEQIADAKAALSPMAISKTDTDSILSATTYNLSLGSETTITLYFQANLSGTDQIVVTQNDNILDKAIVSFDGTEYTVKIPNINAAQLADRFTVTVTNIESHTATISLCALSYANTILNLNMYKNEPVARSAMTAFYHYYLATTNYTN